MMMRLSMIFLVLGISALGIQSALAEEDGTKVTEQRAGKLVIQTISTTGRFGIIEEQRVRSIHSEVRFSSADTGISYHLVGEGSRGHAISMHEDFDNLLIPSWEVFSW